MSDKQVPVWADAKTIHHLYGICKSTLYRLSGEKKIRAASLREPGKLRGKKLFHCRSVEEFIESLEGVTELPEE